MEYALMYAVTKHVNHIVTIIKKEYKYNMFNGAMTLL